MSKSGFCCSALLGLVLFVGLNAKPPTCHTLRQLKDESAKMFPQLRESPTFASTGRGEKTASDDDVEMTMVVWSFELGSAHSLREAVGVLAVLMFEQVKDFKREFIIKIKLKRILHERQNFDAAA